MKHHCKVLGVRETATSAELHARYRQLVKEWHPDKFASDPRQQVEAEARFKRINEAYRALAAERRRSGVVPEWQPPPEEATRHRIAGWLQSKTLLTYLPLVLVLLVAAEQRFELFIPATPVAAALLASAWFLMAQRVWRNAALTGTARILWIVSMAAFAFIAVPIYFAHHDRLRDG